MRTRAIRTLAIVFGLTLTTGVLAGWGTQEDASRSGPSTPACSLESLPQLPDVRLTSVTDEAAPGARAQNDRSY